MREISEPEIRGITRYQAYQHNFTALGSEGWLAKSEIKTKKYYGLCAFPSR